MGFFGLTPAETQTLITRLTVTNAPGAVQAAQASRSAIGADVQKGTNGIVVPILLGALGVLLIIVGVWSLGGGQTIAVVTKAAKAGAA